MDNEVQLLTHDLFVKQKEIELFVNYINELNAVIKGKNKEIEKLLYDKDDIIDGKNREVEKLLYDKNEMNNIMDRKNEEIEKLNKDVEKLVDLLYDKDEKYNKLKKKLDELNNISYIPLMFCNKNGTDRYESNEWLTQHHIKINNRS